MSREAGRLTQICVWTAERSADLFRRICTLIADPGERGENLRTSPTNMIESLATHFRQQFCPKVDPGLIDWFDVVPPDAYESSSWPDKLTIHPVVLQHANGVYRDPEWSNNGDNLPQDWIDFVAAVIERSRKPANTSKPLRISSKTQKKRGCHLATAFLLFLCFQWLPFGNFGCSTATSPGVTCHLLADAQHRSGRPQSDYPDLSLLVPKLDSFRATVVFFPQRHGDLYVIVELDREFLTVGARCCYRAPDLAA